jgi:glutathione synthase
MRLGIVVNDVMNEQPALTTSRLAVAAIDRGHEVWMMGVGDLAYDADDCVRARARRAPRMSYKRSEAFLRDLQGKNGIDERITLDDLDVLLLRNDPSADALDRPWAVNAGILFGRVALRHGVIVLNDPTGLSGAMSKMYFQSFPEEVRPRTLITRDRDEIKEFTAEFGGSIVLKPLTGSNGRNIFLVRPNDLPNINQMIDAVSRDGYVIAQEYLPEAADGDTRLFLMNGQPLRCKGKYAAYRRVRNGADSAAGAQLEPAEIGPAALRVAEFVRPKLVKDGMFLVAVDLVGDKLLEIDVLSPDGLGSAQNFEGVNFSRAVVEALERKVQYMDFYQKNFDNVEMAAL